MENNIKTLSLLIGSISITLGVAYIVLLHNVSFGINFPIFTALMLLGGWILYSQTKRHTDTQMVIFIVLALFFSLMVFVHSSELLTFFNILGTILLLLISTSYFTGKSLNNYLPEDYLRVFIIPFRFLHPLKITLSEIINRRTFNIQNRFTREIIRGSFMAIVAVTFFTLLLSSADPIFGKLVDTLFSFTMSPDIFNKLFVFIIVSSFLIGAFGYTFGKKYEEIEKQQDQNLRTLGLIETNILLGSITSLFLVFITIQINYLFGGNAHLILEGFTYADYARKGFFELVILAVISFLIISICEKTIVKDGDKHIGSFKLLTTILIVEVIVILFSAFDRLSLYELAYGFTTIRLYSYAFMIWLGVILALLARHILTDGTRERFATLSFYCVISLLFAMNLLNPDAFIAKKNIDRYQQTGQIDVAYLARLSNDALPHTIQLLDDSEENIRNSFAHNLFWANYYCPTDFTPRQKIKSGDCILKSDFTPWRSSHLSDMSAQVLLLERKNILLENKDYFLR